MMRTDVIIRLNFPANAKRKKEMWDSLINYPQNCNSFGSNNLLKLRLRIRFGGLSVDEYLCWDHQIQVELRIESHRTESVWSGEVYFLPIPNQLMRCRMLDIPHQWMRVLYELD